MTSTLTAQIGTFAYMAPEVVDSQNYTKSCDIYSFGITLWEMLTRTKPYKNMTNVSIGMSVMRKENPLRPSLDEVKEQKWKSLLARQLSSIL
jgi:serine/threonine protein kinase